MRLGITRRDVFGDGPGFLTSVSLQALSLVHDLSFLPKETNIKKNK